jgi:hypothetical protein
MSTGPGSPQFHPTAWRPARGAIHTLIYTYDYLAD